MRTEAPRGRRLRRLVATFALVASSLGAVACRVDTSDLDRWKTTEHGPAKLMAVVNHDKYDMALRIEAGWALIEMKKRGGQSVGIDMLINGKHSEGENYPGLVEMASSKDRAQIIEGLWKRLQPKVLTPVKKLGDGKFQDDAALYKDATFALYAASKTDRPGVTRLEIDKKVIDEMTDALAEWAAGKVGDDVNVRLQAFEARLDNSAQVTSVEQVLRSVGVAGTKRLPSLLKAATAIKSQRLDTIVNVVCDVKGTSPGDPDYEKARAELSTNYASIIDQTVNPDYTSPATYLGSIRNETDDLLRKQAARKDDATIAQVYTDTLKDHDSTEKDPEKNKYLKYMLTVRAERVQFVFTQAKRAGQPGTPNPTDPQKKAVGPTWAAVKPVSDELLTLAKDGKNPKDVRALALAALEGDFETCKTWGDKVCSEYNEDNRKVFLDIVNSDTTEDEVKHGALVRIAEYDPPYAVKTYYSLFTASNWKVRFDAAAQVIGLMKKAKLNSQTTVKEFLSKLPDKPDEKVPFALGEPPTYGQLLSDLDQPTAAPEMKARETILAIANAGPDAKDLGMGAELTVLGYFFAVGTPADSPLVDKFAGSRDPTPKCKETDDCKWTNPAPACPQPKAGLAADQVDYNVSFQVSAYKAPDPKQTPPPPAPIEVKCTDSIKSLGDKGKVDALDIKCPADCTDGSKVWGGGDTDGKYTTDSAMCVAAVHAGVSKDAAAGLVHVNQTYALTKYTGTKANGVTTNDWVAYPKLETAGDYAKYCVKPEIARRAAEKAADDKSEGDDEKEQPK